MLEQSDVKRQDSGRRKPDALADPEPVTASVAAGLDSQHGTVARNAFYLMVGQVLSTVLGVLFSAALGRNLGAGDFGVFFLISSFSAFAYVLVDWGQQLYILREVARQPEKGSLLLGTALVMRVAGGILVILPSGLIALALGYDTTICWYTVLFIATYLPFFLSQGFAILFRARDRMSLDAGPTVANKFVLLGLTLAVFAVGGGLWGVLASQALAGLVALAISFQLYRHVSTDALRFSPEVARQILLCGGAPFVFTAVSNVQPYIDAVLLSEFAPADAIGWYGAAKNIMTNMLLPAFILGTASFPRIARAATDADLFKVEIRAAMRPIVWLGALAAVGTFLFADDAIAIVYGQRHFGPAGIILKVFAPVFVLLFMNVLLSVSLYAIDRAKAYSIIKVSSVVVCTTLALILIPYFQQRAGNGGIGVVTAFVASEVVVFVGAITLLWGKGVGSEIPVDMARAVGSAALTLLLFWWMPPLSFWVGAPICVTAFLLFSVALGLVRRSDVQTFKALLRKGRPATEPSTGERPAAV